MKISDIISKKIDYLNTSIVTGDKNLDEIRFISAGNSFLLAGKQGSGKTKYAINLVRNIILNNDNVSILWYSFEDSAQTTIKSLISGMINISNEKMTEEIVNSDNYKYAIDMLSCADIYIKEDTKSIYDIKHEFLNFAYERKDRFSILIIDNIITLEEILYNKEDKFNIIRGEIISLQKTIRSKDIDAYIFCLHHIDDKELSSSNKNNVYRLKDNSMIGTSELSAGFTQIGILNSLFNHTDIYLDLTVIKEIIERLTIIDITKNRNGELKIFRYFNDLKFTKFHPISL